WIVWIVWALSSASPDPLTKYSTDYLGLSGSLDGGPDRSFWWSEATRQYIPRMLATDTLYTIWSAGALPLGGLTRLTMVLYPTLAALLFGVGVLVCWRIFAGTRDKPVLTW